MKFLAAIALPAYVLDQLTKWWIVTHFSLVSTPENLEQFPEVFTRTVYLPEALDVIPGWFQIVYWANTGAAFSMGHGRNAFFIGLSLVTLVGLLIAWTRKTFTLASDEGLIDAGLKLRTLRLPDVFQDHDKPEVQYAEAGLDADAIVESVLKALRINSAGVAEAKAEASVRA